MDQILNVINHSAFGRLALMMVGLGVMVGLIFPPFMIILGVETEVAIRPMVFGATIVCGVMLGAMNLILARAQIGRRVMRLKDTFEDLTEEREVHKIPFAGDIDMFGDMAKVLDHYRAHLQEKRDMEIRQAEIDREREEDQALERENLAYDFEAGVKSSMDGAHKDTEALLEAARSMGESAEHSLGQAQSAIKLSDTANQGVNEVAMAAEALSENVRELSTQMRRSSQMSKEAVERASEADTLVAELGEATRRIEDVAQLIVDIADQTNMLALNATIEAARAGEAGKGFAVVAGEVKNLATQTAKATDEITAHINSIRGAGDRARIAMSAVSTAIDQINTISSEVTEATDQQNASISRISVNARDTSDATNKSVEYIREVGDAIEQTGYAAHEMLATVDDMARQMKKLAERADHFVTTVRDG